MPGGGKGKGGGGNAPYKEEDDISLGFFYFTYYRHYKVLHKTLTGGSIPTGGGIMRGGRRGGGTDNDTFMGSPPGRMACCIPATEIGGGIRSIFVVPETIG